MEHGAGQICVKRYKSPVGMIALAGDAEALCGLWIEGHPFYPKAVSLGRECDTPLFGKVVGWLDRYFAGERVLPSELELRLEGTPFRKTVWSLLCDIPYGTTTTYGELAVRAANRLGVKSMAAQAVGGAVGANPISIIIPCHRVVGRDGSLVGFSSGVEVKRKLLLVENALGL